MSVPTRILLSCLLLTAVPHSVLASGHGPVFGGATPTLGRGGWQLDQVWMGRLGKGGHDDDQMLRTMISVGLTEDIQLSGSLPITLQSPIYMPRGRVMQMMTSNQDIEGILAWRFQRRPLGPGSRIESTVFGGISVPLQEFRSDGMRAAPSIYVSAASGYASRTHYFWVGGGYQRSAEMGGDRVGDTASYSVVYGFRPPALQLDYPKPDLRFFVEAVGEHTARGQHHGFEMFFSGGHSLAIGPSVLLLYKAYGLEGGLLFPVYQETNGQPRERFRFGMREALVTAVGNPIEHGGAPTFELIGIDTVLLIDIKRSAPEVVAQLNAARAAGSTAPAEINGTVESKTDEPDLIVVTTFTQK